MRRRWLIAAAALDVVLLQGCWGRCEGGFRYLGSFGEGKADASKTVAIGPAASFFLNADSSRRTPAQLLSQSKIGAETFFLTGPRGRVAAELTAKSPSSAHSCASGANFTLRPRASLPPGDYTLVVLLDDTAWPPISSGSVERYEGKRALVRRYRVRKSGRPK